ncbi:helix-turn-helix domain-containing protein, partial [Enterobacter hormaechei]|nr:helix-turn-helix domain-containing protein [Enterobacter hormaechei]
LRDAREARGWNQSELARRMIERGWAKYSQVSVKRTENAERAVRLDEALDLASVLSVSLVSLIGEQSEGDAAPLLALIAEAEDAQNGLRTAAQ